MEPVKVSSKTTEPLDEHRAGNFLFNSLVLLDKCSVYFTFPDHKTTFPKNLATAIQGLKNYFISTMPQLSEKLNSR